MRITLFTLLIAIILFSCKKNVKPGQLPVDQLSDAQLQLIEAGGIDNVSVFANALFPDGTNIRQWDVVNDPGYTYTFSRVNSISSAPDKIQLFIDRMTQAGYYLAAEHVPPLAGSLAYVYGSKSFSATSVYPGAKCQQPLYGLDCSGMIYQMAIASGIHLPAGGTSSYADVSTWNNAFTSSPDFTGLKMVDMSDLPPGQLQPGDIIVSSGVHIGMVINNGSTLAVLNSLGSPNYSCAINSDNMHGPVKTENVSAWLVQSFGSDYNVLRPDLPTKLKFIVKDGNNSLAPANNATVYVYETIADITNNKPAFKKNTDVSGTVDISVPFKTEYLFIVQKGSAGNIYNGFLVTGISGTSPTFADINGDGIINNNDKVLSDVINPILNQSVTKTSIIYQ